MPVVVLEFVSLVFEGVKGFIFNFPARPSTLGKFFDVFCGDLNVRNPRECGGFALFVRYESDEKVGSDVLRGVV